MNNKLPTEKRTHQLRGGSVDTAGGHAGRPAGESASDLRSLGCTAAVVATRNAASSITWRVEDLNNRAPVAFNRTTVVDLVAARTDLATTRSVLETLDTHLDRRGDMTESVKSQLTSVIPVAGAADWMLLGESK